MKRGWTEIARDGVDTVKGTGENEQVVAGELVQACVEFAVEDETARFIYNEEGVDNPRVMLACITNDIKLGYIVYRAYIL